jgi:two-component system cell cycle sensor histidine kinase/response regulator CckA
MPLNYNQKLERLYQLDYGSQIEVSARLLGVALGSVFLYLHTGHSFAFAWSGGYLASHLIYVIYLQSQGPHVSYLSFIIAQLASLLTVLAFMWMPAWMLVQPDRVLSLVGAGLIGCLLVYLVQRTETFLFLLQGQIVLVSLATFVMLLSVLPQLDSAIAGSGILITWIALCFYFSQSILGSRKKFLAEGAANAQAAQAQKLAAIGQLAGGVAHDFNNILTVISGNLDLYGVLSDPAEKGEAITEAKLASKRASKIVKQLLIFARKSPTHFIVIDANAPLTEIGLLGRHLLPATIQLSLEPLTVPAQIHVDESQLVTGLMNLLVNSADSMPDGGRITMSIEHVQQQTMTGMAGNQTLAAGDYILYTVADTGSGISDEILERVTEPFFTTKEVGAGTGLGLSMVRSIAVDMRGGLKIETSDQGTTMRFFVPRYSNA